MKVKDNLREQLLSEGAQVFVPEELIRIRSRLTAAYTRAVRLRTLYQELRRGACSGEISCCAQALRTVAIEIVVLEEAAKRIQPELQLD